MAVNELDARTRAVEKMKAEPGKEVAAYQAAENQLLAIRAEQKQNLAMARQEGAAAIQQNATIGQAAELAASSGGGAATVQAPVNAATRNVLAKYGAGPTITKSTQRTTQQVTKQNVTINNYNTTTNNTTNNVPNTGPVQGRPVVVNRDDTGRFKVWVKNALDRQNEQAAIRDREYQRRESALTRSANKMTRKLEAISGGISRVLDPRRMNNSFGDQIKRVLKLIGIGVIAANWPKVLDIIGNIEKKFRTFLNYFGITGRAERKKTGADSGFIRDFKYLLLGEKGKDVKGGIGAALKEAFTGKDGIWETIKKSISLWLEARGEAIKAIPKPEISLTDVGGSLKNIAGYVGDILAAIMQGPGSIAKQAAKQARAEAVTESISEAHDSRANRKQGSFKSVDGKEHSTSVGDYIMHGYEGANNLLATDIKNGKLSNNIGASIRQSNYIATNLAGENGKVNPLGIIEGLNKLESSAVDNKYTIVDPYLLGMLQSKLGVYTQDLANKKKKFKYISIKKSEEELEHERELNSGIITAGKVLGAGAGLALAPGGTVTKAAGVGLGAKYGGKVADWLTSEENTIKLVEEDDPAYKDYPSINNQLDGLTQEQKQNGLIYSVLTKEDIETIKKRLAEKVGADKISFEEDDLESTRLLGDYITSMLPGMEVTDSYTNGVANIRAAEAKVEEYNQRQADLWANSKVGGIGERAAELAGDAKEFGLTGYTRSIGGDDEEAPISGVLRSTTDDVVTRAKATINTIRNKDNWDVDKAIDTIKKNANSTSKGQCLRYTANAISAGFGEGKNIDSYHTSSDPNMGGITSAKNSGAALEALGFNRVANSTNPQKGDIRVLQPSEAWIEAGHPHGHIEMYDGNKWYSDFAQKTSGANWGHYSSMLTYRWGDTDSDIIDESSTVPGNTTSPINTIHTQEDLALNTTATPTTGSEDLTEASPEMQALARANGLVWDSSTQSFMLPDLAVGTSGGTMAAPEVEVTTPLLAAANITPATIATSTAQTNANNSSEAIKEGFNTVVEKLDSLEGLVTLAAETGARNVDATTGVASAVMATSGNQAPQKPSTGLYTPMINTGEV